MKKHFFFMTALMLGLVMAVASCKDSKKAAADANGEEVTEKVVKEKTPLKEITSVDELDDLDLENIDLSEFDENTLDNLDFDNLTEKQANNLLALVAAVGSDELPEDVGDGMTLTDLRIDGDKLVMEMKMAKEALSGITIKQLATVFETPELRKAMSAELMSGMAEDEDMQMFMKVAAAAKKDFCLRFFDGESGDEATLTLLDKELMNMLKGKK
ncbi:MAG: hypothetical protein J5552_03730 [Prevotella sp.]|nr:hypothetical protein [Prevotella sp.]